MKDQFKTKQALIQEMASLKLRIAELEQAESERMRVEKKIQLSEADYIEFFGDITDAVYSADAEGKIIFISPAIEQIMGYQPGELEGKSFYQYIHPDDLSMIRGRVGDLSRNFLKPEEYRIITSAGTARWVMSFSRPLFLDGIFQGIRGVITDIHYRKLTEKALQESEERYRNLFENANEAMFVAQEGNLVFLNPRTAMMTGYSAEELMARPFIEFIHPDDRDMVIDRHVRRMKGDELLHRYAFRIIHRDGNIRWVELNAVLINWNGKAATLNFLSDITDRKRIEDALREGEERFRSLIQSLSDMIFVIDRNGQLTYESPSVSRILGFQPGYFIGKSPFTHIHPDDFDTVVKDLDEVVQEVNPGMPTAFRYSKADNTWVYLEAIGSNQYDNPGIQGVVITARDITKRKQIEEALRESEERWQFALEGAGDGVWDWNAQTNKVFFSRQWKAMIGYDDDEIGNTLDEWDRHIHPDDRKRCYDDLDDHFKGKTPFYLNEHRLLCKDGGYKWILDRGKVIDWTQDGKPYRVIGTHTDITERKRVESALSKSEAEITVILESVSDLIFHIGKDMRVIYCNQAVEKFFKLPSGSLGGKVCYEALHHRDKPCSVCPAIRAMESGSPQEAFTSSLGRHWRLRSYPVRDESGAVTGVIETVSDITDMRNAEEKYRSIFENAVEGIYQSTPDGRLVSANPALARIFGYDSPETMMNEVTGVGRSLYVDSDRRQIFLDLVDEQGIAKNFEFEGSKKNGDRIYVSDNARAVKNSKNKTLYYEGIIQDITERKRAEDSLRESEERFRALSENAPDIIYTMNLEGAVTYANPSWKRILGHDEEKVLGRYFTDFVREEDRRTYRKLFKSIRDDEKSVNNYIGVMLTKDGKELVFNMNSAFNRDSKGRIIGVVGTMKDITEQREMEKKLQQAQKLEAIGTLAGGIAHDFNNLLMGIQGYASLSLMNIDPSHPNYERLRRIEEQVQSGADLTKQLLGFARGGRYETRATDMNDIISKTASMFIRTKKEITLYRSLAQDLWTVDCDQGQMEQVLMNLYVNAWQAMPGGGDLSLATHNVMLGDDHALPYTLKPGRYVKVSVTDTGTGMDAKTVERIFDPFFTTKGMGRGTGLGLAMVYGIVKGHGGIIDARSEPGQGTTFDIYLPASEKTIVKEQTTATEILTGLETVLLVDDEPFVLEVTRELLESLGYRVHAAGGGQEAIAVYMEKRNEIDLVILDMIMPGISGGETFDRLREIDPEVRVLLSSGYSIDGRARQILARGCKGFLQKPFQLEKLSRKVREVLSE